MPTPPTVPINLSVANPGLKDLLNAHKTDILQSMNCHAIGTIQTVTRVETTGLLVASAAVSYTKTYFVRQSDGTYKTVLGNYPTLVDCPIIAMGGGATMLSMPVQPGDPCLILFNDRDMNNWYSNPSATTPGPVALPSLHSFSDAIVLVGFHNKELLYDPAHALLTNGYAEVGVPTTIEGIDSGKVRIANQTYTLYNILSALITAIENITVSPGSPPGGFNVGGNPVTGTSGSVVNIIDLETVRGALGELLE